MKIIIISLLLFFILSKTKAQNDSLSLQNVFKCSYLEDLTYEKYEELKHKGVFEGQIKGWHNFKVTNYLSTFQNQEQVQIDLDHWSVLYDCVFDVNKKTIVIIHGLLSSATEPWVIQMKDALLEEGQFNVFMVDWNDISKRAVSLANYRSLSYQIISISYYTFEFFEALKEHLRVLKYPKKNIQWNHLHFIGHSLGAHISAQTAHLLQGDKFFHLDRITGLDPAGPCFHESNVFRKIDSKDADFVDVIHTQSQNFYFSLGTNNVVGDADFYVNGGAFQPECQSTNPLYNLIAPEVVQYFVGSTCSHGLAQSYFTESIKNPQKRDCRYDAYTWNGDTEYADVVKSRKIGGNACKPEECPVEMGYHVDKEKAKGIFLVVTGTKSPYCKIEESDKVILDKVYARLSYAGPNAIFDDSTTLNVTELSATPNPPITPSTARPTTTTTPRHDEHK